jgi:hypothetical protein
LLLVLSLPPPPPPPQAVNSVVMSKATSKPAAEVGSREVIREIMFVPKNDIEK